MIMEEDAEMGDEKALNAAIRSAKKSARPSKIGVPEKRPFKTKPKSKPRRVTSRVGGAFDRDIEQKAGRREGVRAKKNDAIGGMGKKKGVRK
jgi:ATP-dependent RNA helicase DDX27